MKLTKTDLNKLLVEERKNMREKQKASDFLRKSLSIYNGQVRRAKEDFKTIVPFTKEEFREWLLPFVDTLCSCGKKLTIKALAVDHNTPVSRSGTFELSNNKVMCRSCNYRKGMILPDEFQALCEFVEARFTPESQADLWRRLVSGGKMTFGK